jgi:hypothetical protein
MADATLLFDENPLMGTKTFFEMDHGADTFVLRTESTLDPILQGALDDRNAVSDKSTTKWKGDMHKVATLPMVIWNDLVKKGIMFDAKELAKWLNKPENKIFRTKLGRV